MKLLIIQFSPVSHNFLPLGTLFSNNNIICSSPMVTDQVSHAYKITDKIIILYIIIFIFMNRRQENT